MVKSDCQKKISVEGVKLKDMLIFLEGVIGFDGLLKKTNIRAFENNPTINSSLKLLRCNDNAWMKQVVQGVYVEEMKRREDIQISLD